MTRWIANLVVLASALLAMATVTFWVRSYYRLDEWSTADDKGLVRAAISFQGAIHLVETAPKFGRRRWLSHDSAELRPGRTWADLHTRGRLVWSRVGVTRLDYAPAGFGATFYAPRTPTPAPGTLAARGGRQGRLPPAPPPPPAPKGASISLVPWVMEVPHQAVAVSYAWPTALFSVAPLWWLASALRRRRRRVRGWCEQCGYDLRASEGRCPECGTEPRHRPTTAPRPDGAGV